MEPSSLFLNEYGVALGAAGRVTEALLQFRKAIALDSNTIRARFNLARLLLLVDSDTETPGPKDEAWKMLQEILDIKRVLVRLLANFSY